MSAQTFRDLWGLIQLYVPSAPVSLVQSWVQTSYDDLVGKRHWSFLRTSAQLSTVASRSVSVTFTAGSKTITSAAGFVVATDPGLQVRVGTGTPVYTIDTVTNVNTATLTQNYAGASGAATATISSIFLAMPADFRSVHSITDMSIMRPIAWWISRERLDLFDPGRISSSTRFRVLASANPSAVTSLLGQVTYEAWPYPTAAGLYQLEYFKRTDALSDDTAFTGPLATWTSALQKGALSEAAAWPGTPQQKNPYFNLQLSMKLDAEFQAAVKALDLLDDDIYLMDLQQTDLSRFGLAALSADTTLMRQSDATLQDYY